MPKDWDSVKTHIERLYLRENKPLSEVVTLMKSNYGFDASVRAYRMRLSDWGYHKSAIRDKLAVQKRRISPKPSSPPFAQRMEQLGLCFVTFPSVPGLELNTSFPPHISNDTGIPGGSNTPLHLESDPEEPIISISDLYDIQPLETLLQAISNHSLEAATKCIIWNQGLANEQDAEGRTPLHYAALQGAGEFVQLLITGGANVDSVDNKQRTALHLAVRFPKIVEALLEYGPTISPQDDEGNTPLHLAIISCNLDDPLENRTIDLLVGARANVNSINSKKESPLEILFHIKSAPEAKLDIMKTLSTVGRLNLWKLDHKGGFPIYEAASLGDSGKSLVRYILGDGNSAVLEHETYRFYLDDAVSTNHCRFWKEYFDFIRDGEPHKLEAFSILLDQYAPSDVLAGLKRLACVYAAEKFLDRPKESDQDFQNGLANDHQIFSILMDIMSDI